MVRSAGRGGGDRAGRAGYEVMGTPMRILPMKHLQIPRGVRGRPVRRRRGAGLRRRRRGPRRHQRHHVTIVRTDVEDVVTMAGSLRAGDDRSPSGNSALATLTGETLAQGTTKQDKFAIAQKLGSVGAMLSFGVGGEHAADRRQVPAQGPAAARCRFWPSNCATPAFAETELAKQKKQIEGGAPPATRGSPTSVPSDAFSPRDLSAGSPEPPAVPATSSSRTWARPRSRT